MVRRYVWDEEGYPPDGMELVAAADYDAAQTRILDLESELRLASAARDYANDILDKERARIRELETELRHYQECALVHHLIKLEDRIRELEAESASLRADRDANIAAWERVLGKRSEGEAQTYIRELEEGKRVYEELYDAAQARIRELEAMQGHCQIHGECPVCRANRIAGDPRISVASTRDRATELRCPQGIKCGNAYHCADHDICAADAQSDSI